MFNSYVKLPEGNPMCPSSLHFDLRGLFDTVDDT
jgi:hypothetical protein